MGAGRGPARACPGSWAPTSRAQLLPADGQQRVELPELRVVNVGGGGAAGQADDAGVGEIALAEALAGLALGLWRSARRPAARRGAPGGAGVGPGRAGWGGTPQEHKRPKHNGPAPPGRGQYLVFQRAVQSGCGGAKGIRTPDLLRAKQTLSQLSYCPRYKVRTERRMCWLLPAQFSGLLVGVGGLEPPTSILSGLRSNQLSYTPV